MDLWLIILLLATSLVLIAKGGDMFVDGASWIAEASGIPKIIIGATVVSLATTLPEFIVSMIAASAGNIDIAVGNAVGSVTANIGLIMGILLLFRPSEIRRRDYSVNTALMICAAVLITGFGFSGELTLLPCMLLLVIFAVFVFDSIRSAEKSLTLDAVVAKKSAAVIPGKVIAKNIGLFLLGAAFIVGGADLLVSNGGALAKMLGVSDRIIAFTVIAVGTSLPELVTTIAAIIKKQASLSVGNILGANIIDIALILPLCSLVSGKSLPLAPTSSLIDIPACLLVGFIAMVPALITEKFRRWQGATLLFVYTGYVVLTAMG